MKLFVFATARKVREFYENKLSQNALLDKAISVAEFFESVIYSQTIRASEYERLILMKKACERTKNTNKLCIPQEFFAFLKNNEYLFSFFKELSLAGKEISALKASDYYAQYDEHLQILDELLKNYLLALHNANLCDSISLCKDYALNGEFLSEFEELIFDVQGFLNAFEIGVLQRCCEFVRVNLCFKTSKFNLPHLKSLPLFKDLPLQNGFFYTLNLNDNAILSEQKSEFHPKTISLKKFEQRSLQVAFVYERISHFMRLGLNPSDIVVITPDESFCTLLKVYDKGGMLNFASGKSINETPFYHKLKALYEAAKVENFAFDESDEYLSKSQHLTLANSTLKCLKISNFNAFCKLFHHKIDFENFASFIAPLLADESVEIQSKVGEELLFVKALLNAYELTLKELLELFFIRIQGITQSDISGGAVRVMGLLESRALRYEGVIIVDFNDEFIPKRSVNELFLNNEVRKRAGLFSYEMSENLQRFYYENLIKNAKEVAISYVENEQSSKSRFLQELGFACVEDTEFSSKAYQKALRLDYTRNEINLQPLPAPILSYNLFSKPLSHSRLESFIKYKRTYYYTYIKQIPPARELFSTSEAKERGVLIHEFLRVYYYTHKAEFDYEKFIQMLDDECFAFSRLDKALFKLRFKAFADLEKAHFSQGFKVKMCEGEFQSVPYKCENATIALKGTIDRVDERGDELYIIDYKTGKIPENSYQLAFYQALLGQKCEAVFYDLNEAKSTYGKGTKSLDELNTLFKELLEQVGEIEFENEGKNEHCPYALIYEKDLL